MNPAHGNRNVNLDLSKLIFAIILVICHLPLLGLWSNYGYLSVEFFFFVSGFLMMKTLVKEQNSGEFFLRKYLLFLSTFVAAEIVAVPVMTYVFSDGNITLDMLANNYLQSLNEIFMLQMASIPGFYGVGVGWYFSSMMLGLGVIYPIVKRWRDFSYTFLPVCGVILLGTMYGINHNIYPTTPFFMFLGGFVRGIADLSLGLAAYHCVQKIRTINFTKTGIALFGTMRLVLLALLMYLLVYDVNESLLFTKIILIWIYVVMVTSDIAFRIKVESDVLQSICSKFGQISLLIVLCHYWALVLTAYLFPDKGVGELIAIGSLVIVLACLLVSAIKFILTKIFKMLTHGVTLAP